MDYLSCVHTGQAGAIIFIGLEKRSQVNFTHWDSGKPMTYTDWHPAGGIDDPIGQRCGVALSVPSF